MTSIEESMRRVSERLGNKPSEDTAKTGIEAALERVSNKLTEASAVEPPPSREELIAEGRRRGFTGRALDAWIQAAGDVELFKRMRRGDETQRTIAEYALPAAGMVGGGAVAGLAARVAQAPRAVITAADIVGEGAGAISGYGAAGYPTEESIRYGLTDVAMGRGIPAVLSGIVPGAASPSALQQRAIRESERAGVELTPAERGARMGVPFLETQAAMRGVGPSATQERDIAARAASQQTLKTAPSFPSRSDIGADVSDVVTRGVRSVKNEYEAVFDKIDPSMIDPAKMVTVGRAIGNDLRALAGKRGANVAKGIYGGIDPAAVKAVEETAAKLELAKGKAVPTTANYARDLEGARRDLLRMNRAASKLGSEGEATASYLDEAMEVLSGHQYSLMPADLAREFADVRQTYATMKGFLREHRATIRAAYEGKLQDSKAIDLFMRDENAYEALRWLADKAGKPEAAKAVVQRWLGDIVEKSPTMASFDKALAATNDKIRAKYLNEGNAQVQRARDAIALREVLKMIRDRSMRPGGGQGRLVASVDLMDAVQNPVQTAKALAAYSLTGHGADWIARLVSGMAPEYFNVAPAAARRVLVRFRTPAVGRTAREYAAQQQGTTEAYPGDPGEVRRRLATIGAPAQ